VFEKIKRELVGIGLLLAAVVLGFALVGVWQGWKAGQFLAHPLYQDASGNVLTRQRVLELMSEQGAQTILQNLAKEAEKAKAPETPAPPPASPVK